MEFKILLTAKNEFEANIIVELLKENGILCFYKRPKEPYFSNPYLGPTGEFDVYVIAEDYEVAVEVAKEYNFQDKDFSSK